MRSILRTNLWLWLQAALYAQAPVFERLTIDQGLSQTTINSIIQDSQGLLWLATQDGLNVFNGYDFIVYRRQSLDSSSISNNHIQTLLEARNGVIWIGTMGGGINRFDKSRNKFERLLHHPDDPGSLSANRVWSLYEDKEGTIWAGTIGGGLDRWDSAAKKFIHYRHDPKDSSSLSDNRIYSMFEDRSGRFWIATANGINLMDRNSGKCKRYFSDALNSSSLSNNFVIPIAEDGDANLWIGTLDGLNRFNPMTGQFIRFRHNPADANSLAASTIYSLFTDSKGRLWIGTSEGVHRYEAHTQTFIRYQNNANDPFSLSDDRVYSFCEDGTGILWIGTLNGLNKLVPNRKHFDHVKNIGGRINSLQGDVVLSFCEDLSGILWIGTGGGLNRWDRTKDQWAHYKNIPGVPNSFRGSRAYALHMDRDGLLWIGTEAGMNRLDPKSGQFVHFINDPVKNSIGEGRVTTIHEDRDGLLWIGTSGGGISRYDKKQNFFTHYRNNPEDPHSLSINSIICIQEDHEGFLWILTDGGGINRLDRSTGKCVVYRNDPSTANSLVDNRVFCAYEDEERQLWLGTSSGLNKLDAGRQNFELFTEKDGLSNNVVYGIVPDNQGRLWLSTNRGLSRLDVRTRQFRNYDKWDGLQSDEFNFGAYARTSQGEMLFGGVNGFNIFDPENVMDNPVAPPVLLTSFKTFDKDVSTSVFISSLQSMTVPYSENILLFEFTALDFTRPSKIQYAYRMEGFDNEWTYSKRRHVTYTNLDPGGYVFRVRAANSDGVWNQEGLKLAITITPPFWQTWWFRLLSALGLVGAGFLWYTHRVRSMRAYQKQLEKDVAERTQELKQKTEQLENAFDELKSAEAQLIQAEKMASLGQMVAGIAHEINNPISFINGNLDMLRSYMNDIIRLIGLCEQAIDDPQKKQAIVHEKYHLRFDELKNEIDQSIEVALAGTRRIESIIGNLRNFSRLDEVEYKETDINRDLDTVVDLFVQEKNIAIERLYTTHAIAPVFVREMNLCFRNILVNAVQAIREAEKKDILQPGGGKIIIRTERAHHRGGDAVRIVFNDNGAGIPEKFIGKIFEPFFTTREVGQGRGLGLSEAYGIIQKHQGAIEVRSKEHHGTEINITIPILNQQGS